MHSGSERNSVGDPHVSLSWLTGLSQSFDKDRYPVVAVDSEPADSVKIRCTCPRRCVEVALDRARGFSAARPGT